MKSIITIALLLSVMTSYGQKTKAKPCSRCWSYADNLTAIDSMRLWIDKVDHMYAWQCEQRDIIWKLSRAVDILQARIEVLEKRPYFSIDTSGRPWNSRPNAYVTGTAVLDSATKRKP